MSLDKLVKQTNKIWNTNRPFILALLILLAAAAFLRLYKLEEFITFLGDQGRDAIVMKRIATLEDFPGIGPRSSMGQLFLGPFYYYFMAPFLLLGGFSPVGPAFGVAFLSVCAYAFFSWKLKKEVSIPTSLLFFALTTFSYVLIWLNRFSWNPNLLPVFSFFSAYFVWRFIKKPGVVSGAFLGFFIAASIQLHYLMLLILPVLFGYFLYGIWLHRRQKKLLSKSIVSAAVTFGITLAPLIIFDLKNNFLNFRGLISLFSDKPFQSQSTYVQRLNDVLNNMLQHIFQVQVQGSIGFALLAVLLFTLALGWRYRHLCNPFVYLNTLVVLCFILVFAFVESERYQHYYTPVYLSMFLVIAYLISLIKPKMVMVCISILFVAVYTGLNAQKYWFFKEKGNFQTRIAESIADSIISTNVQQPYYMVSIPLTSTNDHIRYYLELKGKTPLAETSVERAENLVILCYETGENACRVKDDPQYQVVMFGDRKIDKEIQHPERVRIFKLVHAN